MTTSIAPRLNIPRTASSAVEQVNLSENVEAVARQVKSIAGSSRSLFVSTEFDLGDAPVVKFTVGSKADADELRDLLKDRRSLEAAGLNGTFDLKKEPEPSRYSLFHLGRGNMLDHILVSRPLLAHYRGAEIHNEILPDESGAFRTDKKFPESDHAPVVAAFDVP